MSMDPKFVRYHRNIDTRLLRHSRDVIIWLPPSYWKKRWKRYPVLYVHDGQNMVDPATSFIGVPWGIDRVAKRLIKKGAIKEFIAVGIYNSPDRFTEYAGGPRGKNYAKFLVKKLKPFIDKTYRTMPDRNNTANLGASMGGLISFLISWWYPNVFSSAACFSSAFLWKKNSIIKEVNAKRKKNIRIYTDCGTKNLDRILLPGYRKMVTALEKKGFKKGVDLEYFFDKDGDHTEIDWSRRLWRPLKFFFNHREVK